MDTEDSVITSIPVKDCKLLLTNYATVQGCPRFVSLLDSMSVDEMRSELMQAKVKLTSRPQLQSSNMNKKVKQFSAPFVITHDVSDADIQNTSEHDIMNELKTMYQDRNLYDSVEWDSLSPEDVRDMVRMERDEMSKYVKTSKVNIKPDPDAVQKPNDDKKHIIVQETIKIEDSDSESEEEESEDEDGDKIFKDATDEAKNETDKFIATQLDNVKKERKTFQFRFTHDTSDSEIYLLSHRRAIRIAKVHAERIDEPLSQAFIDNATTDEVHRYLIHERNEFVYQHEYDTFNLSSHTSDNDIKSLSRLQLENFIIFRYRDTDRQVSETFFNEKTDMELKYLLLSERDVLKANDPTSRSSNATDPKPPNTMPKGLFAKRQNLNGWDINNAMSKQNDNLHNKVFHPSNTSERNPKVIAMSKNIFLSEPAFLHLEMVVTCPQLSDVLLKPSVTPIQPCNCTRLILMTMNFTTFLIQSPLSLMISQVF